VSDIQVSNLGGLLCTVLPDVRSQNLSACGENDMGTGVMGHELLSSFRINYNMSLHPLVKLQVAFQWSIKGMKNTFAYLDSINNLI
jgi:hypothetical protein